MTAKMVQCIFKSLVYTDHYIPDSHLNLFHIINIYVFIYLFQFNLSYFTAGHFKGRYTIARRSGGVEERSGMEFNRGLGLLLLYWWGIISVEQGHGR